MKTPQWPRLDPRSTYVIGFTEILLIALVLVFFFGAKRIPEIAKGLGGGIRGFKSELKEPDDRDRLPPSDDGSR
jgi:sec-independent protein translocase protein TatA